MLFSKNTIRKQYNHQENRFRRPRRNYPSKFYYSGPWYNNEYRRVLPIGNTYLNDTVVYTPAPVPVIKKTIIKKKSKDNTFEMTILFGIILALWFKFSK